ncbi:hypothetical protein ACHAWO_000207 [Cyclotella atomus]|uniref:Cyclin N-terminal domain-containing protein n=1 Tax=Cyclotella atomus TaxID=382360 RepID=A0ABD3MQ51_9STRA
MKAQRRTLTAVCHDGSNGNGADECPTSKRSRTTSQQPLFKHHHYASAFQIVDKISIIQAMKVQEASIYRPAHYLYQANVSAEDRKSLCQWGFDILNACKVNRDIAVIAIGYFDRFLSHRGLRVVEACLGNQRELQLAFISCLVIALKGRESMEVKPQFVAETMCEDMYHPEEIVGMEIEILRTLSWFLNGPTPKDFLEHFMELLPADSNDEVASNLRELACKKLEMSMLDYHLALELPSSLAHVSIASLLQDMGDEERNQLGAASWMSRIGFVMGVSGVRNQLADIDEDEDTSCTLSNSSCL